MMFKQSFLSKLLCCLLVAIPAFASDRHPRPMLIHKLPELGLQIWTEMTPEWLVETTSHKNRSVFTAQTPVASYPPAAFTFSSFAEMRIDDTELRDIAVDVMSAALKNYHSEDFVIATEALTPATYGVLTGYELKFRGNANGELVEVAVFLGQSPNEFPVLLQAYTLAGKLDAIAENMRRSWTSVRYLK